MAYDLKKSFLAGIWYIGAVILAGIVSGFIQFSRVLFVPYVLIALAAVILYALFIYGYVQVAQNAKVALLKVSSWAFIVLAIVGSAVGASMLLIGLWMPQYAQQPVSPALGTAFTGVFVVYITLAIAHAIFAILFGVGVNKVPVESSTKKTLRTMSILEGASVLSIVGFLVAPYFAFESFVFKLLFLYDTYKKEHTGKELRNRLWLFIPLALYLIALVIFIILVFIIFSTILAVFSALAS